MIENPQAASIILRDDRWCKPYRPADGRGIDRTKTDKRYRPRNRSDIVRKDENALTRAARLRSMPAARARPDGNPGLRERRRGWVGI
jgi:hypothetical protein